MTGDLWVASYVVLWIAVLVLTVAVVALLRQIGVLHARIRPMGVHEAGEGPERGAAAPLPERFLFDAAPLTLLAFTAPGCDLCRALLPSLRAMAREYRDVQLEVVLHSEDTVEVFRAYRVSSTPYLVAVGADGVVRGGGIANTMEQAETLVESALDGTGPASG